jgi:hypothetical protein
MGVTTGGNGSVLLLFNPDFVLSLPAAELGGVLLHEVHHVVLDHLLADPADYPDRWARTVAEEVTVNEFVKEALPAGGIHLSLFPGLPEMESTDERYRRLARITDRFPIELTGLLLGGGTGAGRLIDTHAVWEEARKNRDAARKRSPRPSSKRRWRRSCRRSWRPRCGTSASERSRARTCTPSGTTERADWTGSDCSAATSARC